MIDSGLNELWSGTGWTVYEARSVVPRFAEISTDDEDRAAAEHFVALCRYLDQLHGDGGFDRLLPPDRRRQVADHITGLLADRPTGSTDPLDDEDDLDDPMLADVDIDTVQRLDQPVDSSLTIAAGRDLGHRLAESDDWQGDLGRALIALYGYLDELYGGPERFTELLSTAERTEVAERLSS